MTGKGHVAHSSILLADITGAVILGELWITMPKFKIIFDNVLSFVNPLHKYGTTILGYIMIGVSILCYYFGVLLPDIDQEYSTITSILHFHIKHLRHRGVTHSVWFALIFLIISLIWSDIFWVFRFISFGIIAHGIADSLSTSGWCPFYPLANYNLLHGKVVCNVNKHVVLYDSKELGGEDRVNRWFLIISIIIAIFIFLVRYKWVHG